MKVAKKREAQPLAFPNDSAAARHQEWAQVCKRAADTQGERVAGVDYRRLRSSNYKEAGVPMLQEEAAADADEE